jgi:hypothetical protein
LAERRLDKTQRNPRFSGVSEDSLRAAGRNRIDVEFALEGLAAQGAGYTASLDERPNVVTVGGRARFVAALGQTEPEFDLVEHRKPSHHS